MPNTAPNGLVKIGRSTDHGYVEEYLDHEQAWEDDNDYVLKGYSQDRAVVYVKINKAVLLEIVLGTDLPEEHKGDTSQ